MDGEPFTSFVSRRPSRGHSPGGGPWSRPQPNVVNCAQFDSRLPRLLHHRIVHFAGPSSRVGAASSQLTPPRAVSGSWTKRTCDLVNSSSLCSTVILLYTYPAAAPAHPPHTSVLFPVPCRVSARLKLPPSFTDKSMPPTRSLSVAPTMSSSTQDRPPPTRLLLSPSQQWPVGAHRSHLRSVS